MDFLSTEYYSAEHSEVGWSCRWGTAGGECGAKGFSTEGRVQSLIFIGSRVTCTHSSCFLCFGEFQLVLINNTHSKKDLRHLHIQMYRLHTIVFIYRSMRCKICCELRRQKPLESPCGIYCPDLTLAWVRTSGEWGKYILKTGCALMQTAWNHHWTQNYTCMLSMLDLMLV